MREIVIVSGKGGTGKTSLTAAFAALSGKAVIADCDVDASDLHLLLSPKVLSKNEFRSGFLAKIRQERCTKCGFCHDNCRQDAITWKNLASEGKSIFIDPLSCEGCGVCTLYCPESAIELHERVCGEWFLSETRYGPMVHARLIAAAENSGKLVSTVRNEAKKAALEENIDLILVDGPPGIGCPVIASITNSDAILVITEPTVSGEHDLIRILKLIDFFGIRSMVCINKCDINSEITSRIEKTAIEHGSMIVGMIPWDRNFTYAQLQGVSVIDYQNGFTKAIIKDIWETVCRKLL